MEKKVINGRTVLIASEGKMIVSKIVYRDENGNEEPRLGGDIVYLSENDNENNYEEIDKNE